MAFLQHVYDTDQQLIKSYIDISIISISIIKKGKITNMHKNNLSQNGHKSHARNICSKLTIILKYGAVGLLGAFVYLKHYGLITEEMSPCLRLGRPEVSGPDAYFVHP